MTSAHHQVVSYSSSAVDYSHPFGEYGELISGMYKQVLPVNSIENASLIEFRFSGGEEYIDLKESYMLVQVKILNSDGTNLAAGADTAFVDNSLHSLFNTTTVYLNNQKIMQGNVLHAYKNYFIARYGVSKAARDIHLAELQGLTGEAAGQNDARAAAAVGWSKRKAWTAESRVVTFIGAIPSDFFMSCEKYLPPTVDLRLEFKLNDSSFVTNTTSTEAAPLNVKYKVQSMKLYMRTVEVAAKTSLENMKLLRRQPFIMNYTNLDIQTHSIAAGKKIENIRNIFAQQLPKQVFVMLVETQRLAGTRNTDPYKFEHASVEKMVLRKNNVPVMIEQIDSDFSSDDGAKIVYNFFCQALNVGFGNRDVGVTLEEFRNGGTVWAWTLCPDMDANNELRIPYQPGGLQLDIHVSQDRDNPALTAIILGKFGSSVQINELGVVNTI